MAVGSCGVGSQAKDAVVPEFWAERETDCGDVEGVRRETGETFQKSF